MLLKKPNIFIKKCYVNWNESNVNECYAFGKQKEMRNKGNESIQFEPHLILLRNKQNCDSIHITFMVILISACFAVVRHIKWLVCRSRNVLVSILYFSFGLMFVINFLLNLKCKKSLQKSFSFQLILNNDFSVSRFFQK